MNYLDIRTSLRSRSPAWRALALAITTVGIAACGGGGGGGGDGGGSTVGDDARREVLKDIGEQVILPALRDFDAKAAALADASDALADAPADNAARAAAREAWIDAMTSLQRTEVLQVGPAGRSQNPDMVIGGQDYRDQIYSWPVTLNLCGLETAAQNGSAVATAPINVRGMGALEYLLFTASAKTDCAAPYTAPDAAKRAAHAGKLAAQVATLAATLRNRWEPAGGNFVAQWSTAGDGSAFYMTPQAALNAVSVALFYVEKSGKDRKVALTTGIGASGLSCGNPASCPEFLESRLSQSSGANLRANLQTFRDVFTGVNGKRGFNDLLEGIDRNDLATEIITEIDAALTQLEAIESADGFDAAVEAIDDRTECLNASASTSGLPPCALHGRIRIVTDTFRGPIVSALNLAIPNSAAGDND